MEKKSISKLPATPNTSVPQQLAKEIINSKSYKKIAKKLLHDEVLSKEMKATAFNKGTDRRLLSKLQRNQAK